jgi:hypothetical protein
MIHVAPQRVGVMGAIRAHCRSMRTALLSSDTLAAPLPHPSPSPAERPLETSMAKY